MTMLSGIGRGTFHCKHMHMLARSIVEEGLHSEAMGAFLRAWTKRT